MPGQKSLNFCSWNIEGVSAKLDFDELLFRIEKFDFVTLVETWLPYDQDFSSDGFYIFSKRRKIAPTSRRGSGSISVLIKSTLRKGVKYWRKRAVMNLSGGN